MSLSLLLKPSCDVVVVGAGPAGLTAGMYAASLGLKTLILEGSTPPRLALAKEIRNYPGFPDGVEGRELLSRFREHALKAGATIKEGEVLALSLTSPIKSLTTRTETHTSYAVILAVGVRRRRLRIEGEEKLLGLGVSYCAVCDGPLYRGRRVAVIGDGEDAVKDAVLLSGLASATTFIPLKGLTPTQREELARHGVSIMEGARPRKVEGEGRVERLIVETGEGVKELGVEGVFIVTEEVPTVALLRRAGVEVDERGCIKVGRDQGTNIEGVYAAGDCTCGGMQVATAVGEGARAAISASMYVRRAAKPSSIKLGR